MRLTRPVLLTFLAVLLLSGVTAAVVVAARSGGTSDCSQYEGNQKVRCENAQASQRNERIRRHCAENPDDDVCQRAAADQPSPERMRAYCREHPDDQRCQR